MATIIKNDDQIKALNDIEQNLALVSQINQIVATEGEGTYLGFGTGKANRLDIAEPERKILLNLCTKMKDRITKDIRAKANKYKISLDENDLNILS